MPCISDKMLDDLVIRVQKPAVSSDGQLSEPYFWQMWQWSGVKTSQPRNSWPHPLKIDDEHVGALSVEQTR